MMKRLNIILAAAGAMLLTACVKDKIYNTDHPFEAAVTVSTDWNDRGAGIEKPSAYIVSSEGFSQRATAEVQRLDKYFTPGSRTFLLYSDAAGITVSGGMATVSPATLASGGTGTYIDPLPGWLFTGTATATLDADSEIPVPVAMHQQVRQLTLVIEPDGTAASDITAITASLSGVAGSMNIAAGTHDTPSNVAFSFVKQTSGDHAGKWTATVRLLGLVDGLQKLTGEITVTGLTDPVPLESDLSDKLTGFNSDKKLPLTLSSTVTVEPDPDPEVEAGFTATINGWNSVTGGTGIAN